MEKTTLEQVREYERKELDPVEVLMEKMDAKVAIPKKVADYTWRDVEVNSLLSPAEKDMCWSFIKQHKEFFNPITEAYPNRKLPDWTKLDITLNDETPWQSRAYPLSRHKRQHMRDIIKKQLDKGMIRHSSSPYSSPAFLVKKSSGGYRLVCDMRKLNKKIEKSCWPIPRIREILDKLKGARYMTSIDLVDGFHQISITENSMKYTGFITEDGLYEECTMRACPLLQTIFNM